MHETQFTAELISALNAAGRATRVHRQNVGSVPMRTDRGVTVGRFVAGPRKGAADISGVVRPWGIRLEVETKHTTEQSPEQIQFERSMTQWGAVYVLCPYSKDKSMRENLTEAVEKIDAAIAARLADLREQLKLLVSLISGSS